MSETQATSDNQEIPFKDVKKAAEKLVDSPELESKEISQSLQADLQAKQLAVQIHGQEQFLGLQKDWASHIKWQIWAVLIFQFMFVFAVGLNLGGFTEHILKLPNMYILVVLQSLANIIALGFVVARFLFPPIPKPK